MLRTIVIGTSVFVQGIFEKALPDGRIAVRDGGTLHAGRPVQDAAA